MDAKVEAVSSFAACVARWRRKDLLSHAQPLLKVLAEFNPEFASQFAFPGYDDKAIDLKSVSRSVRAPRWLQCAMACRRSWQRKPILRCVRICRS